MSRAMVLALVATIAGMAAPVGAQRIGDDPATLRLQSGAWPPEQLARLREQNPAGRQIVVTIPDPHAGRLDLSGRPGPRYLRRSDYRVSTGIRRTVRRIESELNVEAIAEWPIRTLQLYCLVFHVPESQDVSELIAELHEHYDVRSAEPLNVFETRVSDIMNYDDPYASLQHALATLQLAEAHSWTLGERAEIAIIDTGADLHHPDLRGRIAHYQDFTGNGKGAFSADRHGTAVAGVIGAAANNGYGIVGIAPASRMQVLKACWHSEDQAAALCNTFTLAQALAHAIDSGARIINLSLAGPADTLLRWLLDTAIERGIVVVAAAPPEGKPRGFPSAVPGVIVADSDQVAHRHAPEGYIVVGAPAEDILVTAPDAAFDFQSGSSLAAAHVSGIAALLLSAQPAIGHKQVAALLTASSTAGQPSVSACRALALLLAQPRCGLESD